MLDPQIPRKAVIVIRIAACMGSVFSRNAQAIADALMRFESGSSIFLN